MFKVYDVKTNEIFKVYKTFRGASRVMDNLNRTAEHYPWETEPNIISCKWAVSRVLNESEEK